MKRLKTPAVVLRTVDYGEADRVVTLLARDGGRRAALARGARKSHKRFGASLSLFGVGEATLVERPGADLDLLEAFDGARGFAQLGLDMARIAHASYAVELVRELAPPRQPEPELFDLLVLFLDLTDGAPPRAETLRVFELRLLNLVGLMPRLDGCLRCDEDALDQPGQILDVRQGGVVCGACRGAGPALDGEARRALVEGQQLELGAAAGWSLPPAVNAACRDALAAFFAEHLGRPLKSLEFIAKLNRAHAG